MSLLNKATMVLSFITASATASFAQTPLQKTVIADDLHYWYGTTPLNMPPADKNDIVILNAQEYNPNNILTVNNTRTKDIPFAILPGKAGAPDTFIVTNDVPYTDAHTKEALHFIDKQLHADPNFTPNAVVTGTLDGSKVNLTVRPRDNDVLLQQMRENNFDEKKALKGEKSTFTKLRQKPLGKK